MRPIIALLTDFGLRDHYVAAMKGVILSIAPEATLVDITHDIDPQDVVGGALELEAAYAFFPPGTVFVAVVDPGVGSSRRALAASAQGRFFVGPDNGLLSPALTATGAWHCRELTDPRFWRPHVSRTFEGRDRFAPVAARLATGTRIEELGGAIEPIQLAIPEPLSADGNVVGEVIKVDHFGNLITNIGRDLLGGLMTPLRIDVDGQQVSHVVATFADVPHGTPCALVGSSERLAIVVNGGSARRYFGARRGTAVRVFAGA